MAVIQYRDKFGNVRTVNSIKGDRGPIGPRGPQGPIGPTGPKGGTLIRGSMPTLELLKEAQHLLHVEIGDGYIIEDEEQLYIWNGEDWVKSPSWIPVKLDHLLDVHAPETSTKHSDVLTFDSKLGKWVNKQLEVDSGIFTTSEDITVTTDIGGFDKGDIIEAGTGFQKFVKDLVGKPIPPVYNKPILKLVAKIDDVIYRGTTINPTLKLVFIPGDSGEVIFCHLYRNEQKIDTFTTIPEVIYTTPYQLDDDVVYKVIVEYNQGDIKVNSENKPDPEGRIEKGTIEASLTVKKGIPYWYYSDDSITDPTIMDIMSKDHIGFNLTSNKSLELLCNKNSKTLVFAYPKELGLCKNIDYVGFDPNSEDIFKLTEIDMYDTNYSNPIPYYVYSYTSPIEIGTAKFILNL